MAKNTANGKNGKGAPAPKNTPQVGDKDTVTDNPAQAQASQETAAAAPGVQGEKQELAAAIGAMGDNSAALFVRTRARNGRRRRAGLVFTHEPVTLDLDVLTDEQIAAIKADPLLVVETRE